MIELNNHKYLIDGTVAKLWTIDAPEDSEPFLFQPHNPETGLAFASPEEAEQWIIEYINRM